MDRFKRKFYFVLMAMIFVFASTFGVGLTASSFASSNFSVSAEENDNQGFQNDGIEDQNIDEWVPAEVSDGNYDEGLDFVEPDDGIEWRVIFDASLWVPDENGNIAEMVMENI